jgi:hypothetical protein
MIDMIQNLLFCLVSYFVSVALMSERLAEMRSEHSSLTSQAIERQ